ncbi:MAG: hypothetical protein KIT25_06660 [Enhydrobacter sp.]|nr:MAG: hypothetical protein KIT25_06660 [Enhydrobacter sp.]
MTARDNASGEGLNALDVVLIVTFLLGLYLGVSLQITSTIPLTCAPSGLAGLFLLWRWRDRIEPRHLAGLLLVVTLYLGSILSATDISFLSKRFTGLVQITYSLVIAYAFFLAIINGSRDQIAAILLAFCLFIIVGCLLEAHTGLRDISDRVREVLYNAGQVYDADRRDELLYGKVRPKLFTSEPSAVTFAYTQFAAVWLALSRWRLKFLVYVALIGMGVVVLPGPTLVLMLLLACPYLVFLGGERGGRARATRIIGTVAISLLVVGIAVVLGKVLFAERLADFERGKDASFFYRFTGPMLVAFDMFHKHPVAGAGLTGEPFIANDVTTVYMNSAAFDSAWRIPKIADVITNYFWLHWIYLGLVWGSLILVALSLWLRQLGVSSLAFCWTVWLILGQASGSYVGPKTWAVLMMAAAASVVHARSLQTATVEPAERYAGPSLLRRRFPRLARGSP